MTFTYEVLLDRLRSFETAIAPPVRYLVAYSGGMDSTVLLHALACSREQHQKPVVAVHINHHLQQAADDWESHCRDVAQMLAVPYESRSIQVVKDAGGWEAAAREARYAAFSQIVQRGDWLLSAHHEDDQAETLLMNLLRGSGPAGLAGIGAVQQFGAGHLLRPLLGFAESVLHDYAVRLKLQWIEDPSNQDAQFDRNYLRQEVMPKLAARWPAVAARFRQSADLASESARLLAELADLDLQQLGGPARLSIGGLAGLSLARQRNVVRRAVRLCGLPPAPATRLYQAVHELIPARSDAQPLVHWPGGELRRYRDQLYVLAPAESAAATTLKPLCARRCRIELGPGQGELNLVDDVPGGIRRDLVEAGLVIRYRAGGEEIRPHGRRYTRKLKKLLQDEGVVPWMRQRIPLLFAGDKLVAVADLCIADEYAARQGWGVHWERRPALH